MITLNKVCCFVEAEIKREQERKEQERKRSPRVDFVPGGIQTPVVIPILKTSAIPGTYKLAGSIEINTSC